jgi:mRNA-degrading endonuclease YafQ of YafQ-DinJ toxin-antitoxin module
MHESNFSDQQFKKDLKRVRKQGKDLGKLKDLYQRLQGYGL